MIPNSFQPCGQIKLQLGLILLIGSSIACPLKVQANDLIQIPEPITQTPNISSAPLQLNLQDFSASSSSINPLLLSQEASEKGEEPVELLETQLPPLMNSEAVSSEDVPTRISVKKFKFEGQTVFEVEQLEKVAAQFIKDEFNKELPTELTFAQLLQVRSAITQFYIKAGYITSGAFIPEQAFQEENGMVRIQIVEGKSLAEQDISVNRDQQGSEAMNNPKFNLNYECLKQQLARQLAVSRPLNQNRILDSLRLLLQSDPRIASLDAELKPKPGSDLRTHQLEVKVREKQLKQDLDAQFTIDNSQSPSVGSVQRQVQLRFVNMFKAGETSVLSYANTDGSNALEADVTLPIGENDSCISEAFIVRGGIRSNEILERPFNRLDIQSTSRYLDLTWRQEKPLTPGEKVVTSYTFSSLVSDSTLLGIPFPFSTNADDKGVTRLYALRIARERMRRSNREALSLRGEFSLGTTVIPGDDLGMGWNSSGSVNLDPSTLLSTGLGLQFQPSDRLTARVDWGIPLVSVDSRGDSLQEEGVYFSIRWTPFSF
jgi:hemolysin activation/secretion protein